MSLVLENLTSHNPAAAGTSLSFNHTPPAGTNLLVAFLCTRGSGAYVTGQAATWNGTALSLLGYNDHSSTFFLTVSIFILAAPSIGTYSLAMSWTGTARAIAGVYSFSGADSPSAGSILGRGGTTTPMTRDITSAVGDIVLAAICMEGNTDDTLDPIAGVTEDYDLKNTNVFGAAGHIAGDYPTASIGWDIGNRATMLAFNIPATPPPFTPRIIFT